MPYFFEVLSTPLDDEHLWQRLEEIWQVMRDDLMGVHFETEQEALEKVYRKSLDPDDPRFDSLFVARYRATDDRDNLLFFHGRALEALAETEVAIAAQIMTAQFLNEWSVLLSCHGFVTAAVMARGPDLEHQRAGRAGGKAVSVDAQRIWFSHYFIEHYRRSEGRSATEDAIELLLNRLVTEATTFELDEVSKRFFGEMLQASDRQGDHRSLKDTYRQTKLSVRQMRKLVHEPAVGIPLLNPKVPLPRVGRS